MASAGGEQLANAGGEQLARARGEQIASAGGEQLQNDSEVVKEMNEDIRLTTCAWQEHFLLCRARSDGRCGAHCLAAKIYNDETKEKKVMGELNLHMLQNWEIFKNHFSFPHSHSIGMNSVDKTFKNEAELKNFIQNVSVFSTLLCSYKHNVGGAFVYI